MSVINSVLKDLDSKPTSFAPLGVNAVADSSTKISPFTRYWWVVIPVVLLAIGVYAVGAIESLHQVQVDQALKSPSAIKGLETPIEQVVATQKNAEETLQPAASAQLLPNQITGLQISENAEYMQLEFQLTEFAPSFLKQRSNNRYVFIIRDVINAISTPIIADSPWLKQIQISTLEPDIEIRFDTQPGVLVDTQERRDDSAYYWLIRLKKNLMLNQNNKVSVQSKGAMDKRVIDGVSQSEQKTGSPSPVLEMPEEKQVSSPVKLQIRPVKNQASDQLRLDAAINSAKQGELTSATQALQQLLGSDVDRQARIHLLSLLDAKKMPETFNSILDSSLEIYPGDIVFQLYEANRLFSEKQYQRLIDKFSSVTDNLQMVSLMATSYQRTEQHQLAVEYFGLALKMNPQQPRLWISLAISQQNLSQRDQALDSYQMALRSGAMSERLHEFVQSKIKQLSN